MKGSAASYGDRSQGYGGLIKISLYQERKQQRKEGWGQKKRWSGILAPKPSKCWQIDVLCCWRRRAAPCRMLTGAEKKVHVIVSSSHLGAAGDCWLCHGSFSQSFSKHPSGRSDWRQIIIIKKLHFMKNTLKVVQFFACPDTFSECLDSKWRPDWF